MRGHLCILSSNATTLESNMSDIDNVRLRCRKFLQFDISYLTH